MKANKALAFILLIVLLVSGCGDVSKSSIETASSAETTTTITSDENTSAETTLVTTVPTSASITADNSSIMSENKTDILSTQSNDIEIGIDTHPEKYEDTRVDRTFDVTVSSSNAVITEVSYKLKGEISEESEILGTSSGTYSVKVLLEGGDSTFTVFVTTEDSHTFSKQVNVTYNSGKVFSDGGWAFEEYEKNGIILVPVYEYRTDVPDFYVISNVIDLYFTNNSTKKEQNDFILEHSDIFESKIGELNSIGMAQIKLKKPLTEKTSLTYDEYIEICKDIESFVNLSPIVKLALPIKYHNNARPDILFSGR